ncbi:hypothetical protein [Hymenobacter sp. BRD67]|uniref:hypothetical protein n=1 Tax=Hymenobacter sp. BRD67 TaxID=2675877 RepID=UPI0015633CE3|nr:hypothetical protein [Hymenobacter sp. BRD67]QKG51372.1 hypothetical protein GKZ67_00710 [Hymenobacter sp. BRD67]
MLSTTDYTALPPAADLQRLCQALAALDAVNSPDEEYRYFSYNPEWSENEAAFELNDGEGDQLLVLFRPEGCVMNGFLAGYDQPDKALATHGLPAAFEEFMFGEPVASIGTTFCLWYTPVQGWQGGAADGSEELLFMLDNQPATYAAWATEYYTEETDKKPVSASAVAPVYRHEVLTRARVLALVDELEDWPQLAADLQQIGYPYDFEGV